MHEILGEVGRDHGLVTKSKVVKFFPGMLVILKNLSSSFFKPILHLNIPNLNLRYIV